MTKTDLRKENRGFRLFFNLWVIDDCKVKLCLSNIAGNSDMNNENKNHKNLIQK